MKIPRTKRYSIYKKLVLIEEQQRITEDNKPKVLNFEPDSRSHYVYKVTDNHDPLEKYYYGSHTPTKNKKYNSLEEEFWTYGTSSKKKDLILKYKEERFSVKIIKVFDNSADKIIYESFLHNYFNVSSHNAFFNDMEQNPWGFGYCDKIAMKNNKGECFWINKNDKKILEDNLIYINQGYVSALNNKTKNKEYITTQMFHDNSEYSFHTKDKVVVFDTRDNTTKSVSAEEYHKYDYYVSVSKDKIPVLDTRDNTTKSVSTEEYHKYDYYVSVSKDKVIVRDTRDNTTKSVYRDEFIGNNYYVSVNKDKVVVFDTRDNTTKSVRTEEYYKYDYYVCVNKDKIPVLDTRDNTTKSVYRAEFIENNYYIALSTGKIPVLDTRDNTTKYISTEEYHKYDYYVSVNKDKVVVFDTRDNTTKSVRTEEYHKYDYYVSVNKDKVTCKHILTGERMSIPKSEFDNSLYLVGNTAKYVYVDRENNICKKNKNATKITINQFKEQYETNKNR